MIGTLIRRDQALRVFTGRTVAVLFGGAAIAFNVLLFQTTKAWRNDTPLEWAILNHAASAWILIVMLMVLAKAPHRCRQFELGLPIPTRDLWRARVAALMVAGLVLLTALAAILLAINTWLTVPRFGLATLSGTEAVTLGAHLVAGLFLAVVIIQAGQLELSEVPWDARSRRRLLLTLGAVFALIVGLSTFGPAAALITLGLAAGVAYRTYRSLPPAFSLAPVRPGDEGAGTPAPTAAGWAEREAAWQQAGARGLRGRTLLFDTIWRTLYGRALGLFYFLMIGGFGLLLSGAVLTDDGTDIGLFWIVMVWYLLIGLVLKYMKKLYVFDPLPISRRALFAFLMVPGLAFLFAGYGAGKAVLAATEDNSSRLVYVLDEGHYDLRGSVEHFSLAWDGNPPPLESPWGETHAAKEVPLYRGSRAVLYKPFTVPEGASLDFAAYQLSRALELVYGRLMGLDEVKNRYFTETNDGGYVPREEGEVLTADLAAAAPRGRGTTFPLVFVLGAVPSLLILAGLTRWFREGVSLARKKMVLVGTMGLVLAIHIATVALMMTDVLPLRLHLVPQGPGTERVRGPARRHGIRLDPGLRDRVGRVPARGVALPPRRGLDGGQGRRQCLVARRPRRPYSRFVPKESRS